MKTNLWEMFVKYFLRFRKRLLKFFSLTRKSWSVMTGFKLVIFDMDGTLLTERTIFVYAEKKELKEELLKLINSDMRSYEKTLEIAKFLKGMNSKELLEIFRKIPLQEHVEAVINEIKRKGIKTAIITNSYRFVAEDLGKRLGIDYVFANDLIINNGIK